MRNAGYQQFPEREAEALTFGRYALTRKLSQGGMAEIYLARQSGIENFEKEVVVKIVLPTLADDLDDHLLLEVLDAALARQEYLEGQNLLSIIQRAIKTGYALPLGFI